MGREKRVGRDKRERGKRKRVRKERDGESEGGLKKEKKGIWPPRIPRIEMC